MLSQKERVQFDEAGYLVVENVLPVDLLTAIRQEAVLFAEAEPDSDRRVWHERALFRRKPFRRLFECERLIQSAQALIGSDVQLLALDLLLVRAGKGNVGWHRDISFVCSKTLSINTGIYLQDLTDAMGPLRVVPGSHRLEEHPPQEDVLPGQVKVYAPAGSAVFFDAGLWHSASRNESSIDRWALFPYFGHYWIKRMDNYFTQSLPADLLASTDPLTRQLLGLGLREGVRSYHGDDEGYNRRGEPGIDFPEAAPS